MKNDIGQKFGKLTAIELEKDKNGYNTRYLCKCDCGNTQSVSKSHLRSSKITHCGCVRHEGARHQQWTGVGEISGDFWWSHVIRSANGSKNGNQVRKPKELTLTIQQAWDLFLQQDRKCALSGILLTFPKVSKDKSWTASLDRIDSSKGYVLGNVQWVHKDINIMKNKFDNQYFIEICKQIYNFQMAEIFKQELKDKGFTILNKYTDSISYKQGTDILSNITAGGACEVA